MLFLDLLQYCCSVVSVSFTFLKVVIVTLPRDASLLLNYLWIDASIYFNMWRGRTPLHLFYEQAKRRPNDPAFIGIGGRAYTFREFECESNKLAVYFETLGLKPGDCVGLLMENRPEYILCWYSLGKIRVISSFLNVSLKSEQLMYQITTSKCDWLIFSNDYEDTVLDMPLNGINLISFDGESCVTGARDLQDALKTIEEVDVYPRAKNNDLLCYLFTSGTTGLPKPVPIKYNRAYKVSVTGSLIGVSSTDRLYVFMPLSHMNSGIFIVMMVFVNGCCLVIRKKFSSSNFVEDCLQYKINAFNYVGEVCRYICNRPPCEREKLLELKFIFGNGLRKNVWAEMKKRFKIGMIVEGYGSSEGNIWLINLEGRIGCCGYYPVYFRNKILFCIVKADDEGELVLDSKGRPITCGPNETGHMLGNIKWRKILTGFGGYLNPADTEKRIRRNLFKDGDAYFLTGDLSRMDEYGYVYFVDRVGDTFRWKGENTSTTELENFFHKLFWVKEAIAYGVLVPGTEGRAGMLALSTNCRFDPLKFLQAVATLPSYQRPIFVRLVQDIPISQTMKYVKTELKHTGFNITLVRDPIYVCLPLRGYTRLTEALYTDIIDLKVSF